jgi:hypothetical protein
VLGASLIDYPKKDSMYKSYNKSNRQIYGKGFTIYKTLDDIEIDRRDIRDKILSKYFDYVIFSDISEQYGYYLTYYNSFDISKIVILDGDDSPKIFPYYGRYWRKFPFAFLTSFQRSSFVFKREWTPKTLKYRSFLILPEFICKKLYQRMNLNKVSFGIPEEKIVKNIPEKNKLFGLHIVDQEVIDGLKYGDLHYVFDNEAEYYHDLQSSKFAITNKRAGWDCMRHYEIAANGAVPCFRNLELKPEMCAPHGLVPGVNCISYKSFVDLMNQINSLDVTLYNKLQTGALVWVKSKSTKIIAEELLSTIGADHRHDNFRFSR